MGDDDGGLQWFQQAGLEQNFQEIFGHREVKNYERSNNDTWAIRNRKINQPAQHESSRDIADSNGGKATPF